MCHFWRSPILKWWIYKLYASWKDSRPRLATVRRTSSPSKPIQIDGLKVHRTASIQATRRITKTHGIKALLSILDEEELERGSKRQSTDNWEHCATLPPHYTPQNTNSARLALQVVYLMSAYPEWSTEWRTVNLKALSFDRRLRSTILRLWAPSTLALCPEFGADYQRAFSYHNYCRLSTRCHHQVPLRWGNGGPAIFFAIDNWVDQYTKAQQISELLTRTILITIKLALHAINRNFQVDGDSLDRIKTDKYVCFAGWNFVDNLVAISSQQRFLRQPRSEVL